MRKATPRSQTGCLNCRKRHVKCGEEKPVCKRCIQYGSSECIQSTNSNFTAGSGGSFHSFSINQDTPPSDSTPAHQWLMKKVLNGEEISGDTGVIKTSKFRSRNLLTPQEKHKRSTSYHELTYVLLKSTSGIPFQVPGSENERRLFQYFQLETVPDISGYSNHDLWYNTILSWSHEEPVLRYAIVALASFHESQKSNLLGDHQHPISLRHYNKAIRSVQSLMLASSKKPRHVILTCCLLFSVIEGLRGEVFNEQRHLNAGLAILKETSALPESNSSKVSNVDADISGLFAIMDIHYSYLDNYAPTNLVLTTENERNGKMPVVPTAFASIREVQTTYTNITNWTYGLLLSIKQSMELMGILSPPALRELHFLSLAYEQVEPAFKTLREPYIARAMTERTCLLESVASIAMAVSFLWSRVDFEEKSKDYCYWPLENKDFYFNEMLFLVETLTKIYKLNSYGPDKLEPRTFFLVRGIVSMTMFIALTAEDVLTRVRGLKAMRNWPKATGSPEELFDGSKIAVAIEAASMVLLNNKGPAIVPRIRDDTIVEVISSLRKKCFLWYGEVRDFGLEELVPFFGFRPCVPLKEAEEIPSGDIYAFYCRPKP